MAVRRGGEDIAVEVRHAPHKGLKADQRSSGRLFFIIWHCRAWTNSLRRHANVSSVSFLLFYLDFYSFIRIFDPDYC